MIELPFPHKALWPNGRAHWGAKAREFRKHKEWAFAATLAILPPCFKHNGNRVDWSVTVYPKTRHAIDDDNARASLKAYQDGIALALGVDDNSFNAPRLHFAEPIKGGRVVVSLL